MDYQPRSGVRTKKSWRDRLIRLAARHPDWALGFGDETWWSRLAQPGVHAWATKPVRLVQQSVAKDDPDPKALAAYGLYLPASDEVLLRFVTGRPVSSVTTQFLADCCTRLADRGMTALLLIWDNASWHLSQEVRRWIGEHNRQVKQARGGVRLLAWQLPVKAPWLNPIEPKWVHAKRAIVEPDRLLAADELEERVCAYFHCHPQERLIAQQVA